MNATQAAIATLGRDLGPAVLARCAALFDAEQAAVARAMPPAATDLAYGPDPRQRLDVYRPIGTGVAPMLAFFHGGGFRVGDKGGEGRWQNANVGRLAARAGFVGVVANYRLVPDHTWPSGGEDVAAVVAWLHGHATPHGGDPARIVLVGTSAGAVHIATWLQRGPADDGVRGVALLSGFYGVAPLDERDTAYFGDVAHYGDRRALDAVAATPLPLFVACAEFDPVRFQTEYAGLLQHRLDRHGQLPAGGVVAGHNHYTMTLHLGTADLRFADALIAFACEVILEPPDA